VLRKHVFKSCKYDGEKLENALKFSVFRDIKTACMVEKNSEEWYNNSSIINRKRKPKHHDRT